MGNSAAVSYAVDIVVFAPRDNDLCVLLIKRGGEPFKDSWALPGGRVDRGETSKQAAERELEEETGLRMQSLTMVGPYDAPDRDPRGRVVSVAYSALESFALDAVAGDDATQVAWIPVDDVIEEKVPLAFDHQQIISDALSRRFEARV